MTALRRLRLSTRPEKPEDREIWDLFRGRCVVCGHPAKAIHEIDFRSSGREAMRPENRVTLCVYHHLWAHQGDKYDKANRLREDREKFLKFRGKHERSQPTEGAS